MYIVLAALKQLSFIALGIGGISALIFFHELGHYLFCKLFKVRTPSFSIGFGPRLYTKRMWDTDFVISAIPLGGYVEIAGMAEVGQGEQNEAFSTDAHSFNAKPYYQKSIILLGGIAFNLLLAYIVFIGIHMTGVPAHTLLYIETGIPTVSQIQENSPAAESKLKLDDTIIAINGITLNNSIENVTELIKQSENDSVVLEIERNSKPQTLSIPLPESHTPHIGIIFAQEEKMPAGLANSIGEGIKSTHRWIKRIFMSYLQMFKKCDTSSMGGPIAIISMMTQKVSDGFLVFALFLAIISINLAVFNLIPVPILDGGQLLIQTIEAIIRRSIPDKMREYIFIGTWVLVLGLTIYLSVFDVKALITPYIASIKSMFN